MGRLTLRQWQVALVVGLFSTSLAIFLTINSVWLFSINAHFQHLGKLTGLSFNQMHQEYLRIINYLENPFKSQIGFKYFRSSKGGLLHFRDVRRLVMFNNLVFIISIPFVVQCVRWLKRTGLQWLLLSPIKIIVTVSLMIVAMMAVSFDQVFIWFHEVLFRNEDWIFDPAVDPVINMLPDTLFLQFFLLFFTLFFLILGGWYFWAKRAIKKTP